MSESERRRKYRYDRVLIETDRVLDPQFDDAVVYLSGAQVEMLRNMTQYLNRLDTYVSLYNLGTYLTPTVADYDDILAIVADLEEVLMGNPNTIWGYKDTVHGHAGSTVSGAGDKTQYTNSVPSDTVWRIEGVYVFNDDTSCSRIEIVVNQASGHVILKRVDNPAAGELVRWDGMVTMKQGAIYGKFYDCLDGDYIEVQTRGYAMEVPA